MSSGSFDLLGRLVNLLVTVSQWWGTLVDLAEKLNSESGESWGRELSRFLRKEPTWICRWHEENGVIRFEVTANGWSGRQWIDHFNANGVKVGHDAIKILLSSDFKITPANTIIKVAVLNGEIFSDSDRITRKIRDFASNPQRKLATPNTDLACLIRKYLTNSEVREMGLHYIVGMSEPVKDSVGPPCLLCSGCDVSGSWLDAGFDDPGDGWTRGGGFAFVEQVSSEN